MYGPGLHRVRAKGDAPTIRVLFLASTVSVLHRNAYIWNASHPSLVTYYCRVTVYSPGMEAKKIDYRKLCVISGIRTPNTLDQHSRIYRIDFVLRFSQICFRRNCYADPNSTLQYKSKQPHAPLRSHKFGSTSLYRFLTCMYRLLD